MSDIRPGDFARPGLVFQVGVPPGCIDILTERDASVLTEAQHADDLAHHLELRERLDRASRALAGR